MNNSFSNIQKIQLMCKHSIDFILSAILLLCLCPLMLVIGCLVKLEDGGTIFYAQKRFGKGSIPFVIYKFRSMKSDGSALTKVGQFIRAWSLDELPQLWNVLKGDMSLVGPRPRNIDDPVLSAYSDIQKQRFLMRPGITGLAQIHGRNLLHFNEMMEWDIRYIQRFSWYLDLKIMLLTLAKVLKREGVYYKQN